jgi:hypothetical protein
MSTLLLPVVAGCGGEADAPLPGATPSPTIDRAALDVSGPVDLLLSSQGVTGGGVEPVQLGTERVRLAVVTLDGGELGPAPAWDGSAGFAFPAYDGTPAPPRAVISVLPGAADPDALTPGGRDFEFGADFMLDEQSSGTAVDNGDNLVQRGLASDPQRFKAELDGGRASCAVRGTQGELVVRAQVKIEPGRWYRLRCHRDDDQLVVRVVEYDSGAQVSSSARSVRGPLGDVAPPAAAPLSVGGKLSQANRVIASATDQFNGQIANPILLIR